MRRSLWTERKRGERAGQRITRKRSRIALGLYDIYPKTVKIPTMYSVFFLGEFDFVSYLRQRRC